MATTTKQELDATLKNIAQQLNAVTDNKKLELLFELLKNEKTSLVSMHHFFQLLCHTGLRMNDPRLCHIFKKLSVYRKAATSDSASDSEVLTYFEVQLNRDQFIDWIQEDCELICQGLKGEFIIPEFPTFCKYIEEIYQKCKENREGKPVNYIPERVRYDHNYWGVSVCTVDGQRFSIGDSNTPFCLQSASNPLSYAIALNDLTSDEVHKHVGQEPTGSSFNELSLNHHNKPHNAMINAGAIAIVSLLKINLSLLDRFDYVHKEYSKMAGGEYIGYSHCTFMSKRETADRDFALGYYMQENKVFPEDARLRDTLDLYYEFCSFSVNSDSSSVIAATLANGGICPLTGGRVLTDEAVRNTLSLMHSCGMSDYSVRFASKVGLPAKSGDSGAVLLVVPNVMGICCWSPPLDMHDNSSRGVQFCEEVAGYLKKYESNAGKTTALPPK